MYHPTRGGVRGGRDQFSWDDVKVDKHRENYVGHSLKAPVGRWQKGKDLHWYTRNKNSDDADMEAAKEEIKRIKEQEEQAMREALGLAPKRNARSQGNRLDKHEFSELVKRGSTAEDLEGGHAEAAHVHGIGFSRAPRSWEQSSSLQSTRKVGPAEEVALAVPNPPERSNKEEPENESGSQKKRRHEEKKHEKRERREKRHAQDDSIDGRKHRKDKEKRRRHDGSD